VTTDGARSVDAADVQVGDDLLYHGTPHRIQSIEPYVGSLFPPESGARIARAADDWSFTLVPGHKLRVAA
jgi:hypothetical protein